jgi:secreted trypsin-like serine protease
MYDMKEPWRLNVLIGMHKIPNTNADKYLSSAGVIRSGIKKLIKHPNFSRYAMNNDLAIIELSRFVPYVKDLIEPACLPVSSAQDHLINDEHTGVLAKISGWGTMMSKQEFYPETIQEGHVRVLSNEECKEIFEEHGKNVTITDEMICTLGQDGQDTCQGDSGGRSFMSYVSFRYLGPLDPLGPLGLLGPSGPLGTSGHSGIQVLQVLQVL